MKRLYIVRHFVEASSVREAVKLAKDKQPDEAYIAEEWMNKVGFVNVIDDKTEGFRL